MAVTKVHAPKLITAIHTAGQAGAPNFGGQHLIVFYAEPDSPTAEALEKLRR